MPIPLAMEEFMIPAGDPGIALYVRNKRLQGLTRFGPERIVLFVHGGTFPAETAFDLELGGTSWMDYIARRGYDTYLLDLRGYGRSTWLPEMDQPAEQHAPLVRTGTALRDMSAAVDFILARRGASKLILLGWSWGTTLMGAYTARHNARVHKLVLYAPLWVFDPPLPPDAFGKLGAFRTVTAAAFKRRWLRGVPPPLQAAVIPPGWFEAWEQATWATDPQAARHTPALLRAPAGAAADIIEFWNTGRPLYDPGLIRVPTLLAHAEWDQDTPASMLHALFARLTNAPYRRTVEIGAGTHMVLMEQNRLQLFRAVQEFLDEQFTPER